MKPERLRRPQSQALAGESRINSAATQKPRTCLQVLAKKSSLKFNLSITTRLEMLKNQGMSVLTPGISPTAKVRIERTNSEIIRGITTNRREKFYRSRTRKLTVTQEIRL